MRPTHLETRYKHDLSPRQCEVLERIARGKTNAEIADELGITLDGAKYHVREILAKLGVESREDAAREWRRMRSPLGRLRHLVLAGLGSLPKSGPVLAAVGAGVGLAGGGAITVIALTWDGGGGGTPIAAEVATATPTVEPTPTPTPRSVSDDDVLLRMAEMYAKEFGMTVDEALEILRAGELREAEAYADYFGLPLDQAIEQLRMQANSGPIIQALRAVAPERLAGIWVEHLPGFHIVVRYTGDGVGLGEARAIAAQSDIPVEVRFGARYTEDELVSLTDRAIRAIAPESSAGGYGDVKTGVVKLWVREGSPEAGDPDGLSARLEAEFDVPIVVEIGEGFILE